MTQLKFSKEPKLFRKEVADWLNDNLCDEFEIIRFRGGSGDEHMFYTERRKWEKLMAQAGLIGLAWPIEYGGRGLDIERQIIFYEEYARAGGPGRVGHIGETLLGPTVIAFANKQQQENILPGILSGDVLWCQGYSEPNAGSDLANIATKARFDTKTKEWLIEGQKVWTSLAHESDWCFVLARCEEGSVGHKGLCYLLVPMKQTEIKVHPIRQITGTSEFNEVFFDNARTAETNMIGKAGDGWRVAMGTLGFERGVSTIGQQMHFFNELNELVQLAQNNQSIKNMHLRRRLAQAWAELQIMRYNTLRVLSDDNSHVIPPAGMIAKLYWSNWHRDFGKLAMDVMGPLSQLLDNGDYALNKLQTTFLYSRADTIYAGTSEIQCNIIAERALGMPREVRTTTNLKN